MFVIELHDSVVFSVVQTVMEFERIGRTSQPHPERLWGPPSLLSNGYQGSFLGGKAAGA
jgi:hypothetical protein